MDFSYTSEQETLRASVRRLLTKTYDFEKRQALVRSNEPWSAETWSQFAELGLLALPYPESDGGIDGTAVDVVAVSELFGEYLTVEPYLGTILLAGRVLAAARGNPAADALLERVISGEAQVAFAYEEGRGTAAPNLVSLSAAAADGGTRLDGEKTMVLGAAQAEAFVVTARSAGSVGDRDGLLVVLVPAGAPGITVTEYRTIDGRSAGTLRFDAVQVSEVLLENAHAALEGILATATIAAAAEAVGAMEVLLRTSAEYASTRKQFGVPIGSFQAIAHRLADMKMSFTLARASLLYTAALAEAGRVTPRDVSVLKAQVGRLGRVIGESAVQIHGGIGTTDELAVGHYLKRVLAVEAMFGDSDYHLRAVGAQAGRSA